MKDLNLAHVLRTVTEKKFRRIGAVCFYVAYGRESSQVVFQMEK